MVYCFVRIISLFVGERFSWVVRGFFLYRFRGVRAIDTRALLEGFVVTDRFFDWWMCVNRACCYYMYFSASGFVLELRWDEVVGCFADHVPLRAYSQHNVMGI